MNNKRILIKADIPAKKSRRYRTDYETLQRSVRNAKKIERNGSMAKLMK